MQIKTLARKTGLKRLKMELQQLYTLGQTFPIDDVDGKACVCHLVQNVDKSESRTRNGNG